MKYKIIRSSFMGDFCEDLIYHEKNGYKLIQFDTGIFPAQYGTSDTGHFYVGLLENLDFSEE